MTIVPMSPIFRRILVVLLLVLGVQYWLIVENGNLGRHGQWIALLVGMLAGLGAMAIPRRMVERFEALRLPSWPVFITTTCVVLIALVLLARYSSNACTPAVTDEQAYILQSRMVARGRLWMERHELADSFASEQLITDRVYASKYPPGTAIAFALGGAVGLKPWMLSALFVSMGAALLQLIVSRLISNLAGVVAVFPFLGVPSMAMWSTWAISHPLMLFLGLLSFWLWLGRRDSSRWTWALGLGALCGASMITRPLETACLFGLLFIGSAILLRNQGLKQIARFAAIVAVGIAPFAALLIVANIGITGDWRTLPWSYYSARYNPYDAIGFPPVDERAVPSPINPKYQQVIAQARGHTDELRRAGHVATGLKRLGFFSEESKVYALLAILVPLSLLGLRSFAHAVLWLMFFIPSLLYSQHAWYCSHYVISTAPAMTFIVLLGCAVLARATYPRLWVLCCAVLIALAVPQFVPYDNVIAAGIQPVNEALAAIPKPAIVLFTPDPNSATEPVYNSDVAWPDDARVIRAHDLPGANEALLVYYAQRQPVREVYRWAQNRLEYLGTVADLARPARAGAVPAQRSE